MAAVLKKEMDVEAELLEGGRGEFTVWVGDEKVAQKNWLGFPSENDVLDAVRKAW